MFLSRRGCCVGCVVRLDMIGLELTH